MPLTISDETLRASGMTEQEAKIEIACRLFDAGKLSFGHASALAGLSEMEMERQLRSRGLPRYRYTEEMLAQDVKTLKEIGRW